MKKRGHLKACREFLESLLTPEQAASIVMAMGGKHIKIKVPEINLTLTAPASPSDHRWFDNWKSQTKRAHQQALSRLAVA